MQISQKRQLQLKILEIIKYIDKLCKANNIEYYLIYGSALGAVRHKGFIPWDDDLDIGMTYDNYLKFIKICENKINKKKYILQNKQTDKNYYLSFSKFRDITTTLIEEKNKNKEIIYGVYVDIFPIVGVPNNKFLKSCFSICRAFTLSCEINVIRNRILYSIFCIIKTIVGKERLYKLTYKFCTKFSCKEYDIWCSVFDGDGIKVNSTTKSIMGKPTYVKFEDTKLPIPENYDKYLTNVYGDYMKIPSDSEKKANEHVAFVLDLNHSYEEYKELNNDKS